MQVPILHMTFHYATVLLESAADKAGLRRGDQFQMVNGMDTSYFSHQQIVKLVKDSAATSLAVKVRRKPLILSNTGNCWMDHGYSGESAQNSEELNLSKLSSFICSNYRGVVCPNELL